MEKDEDNLLQRGEHLADIERWREAVPLLIKVIAKNFAAFSRQLFTFALSLQPTNETAAENLKNQFSYFNVLYSLLVFIPFILIAFFVAPGLTVLITLGGFYGFVKLLFKVRRKRKQLMPELRMFLKIPAGKSLTYRLEEFSIFAKSIYKKTWKPHALAFLALIICHADFGAWADLGSRNWNQALAYLLIIVSSIWLQSKLGKD